MCSNGSFETYSLLPNNYSQICYATGWFNPNGTCSLVAGTGSPDYYNTLGTGGAKAPATWWATVMPHTGNGFEGFATYYSSANYREYIRTTLSTPLNPGSTYAVTFWVTNGVSTLHFYGTNNLGFYFSAAPATQSLGTPILVTPQVETTTVIYSTTWTQVTFLYTPTSPFQNLCIGNFHNDLGTTRALFGPNLASSYGCYYYIDDISITLVSPLPVELLSFTGKNKDHVNELSWSTASEKNNDHFEIEKSEDGTFFTSIGVVPGNGNKTCLSEYGFSDRNIKPGLAYYRLKQVDYDGNFKFSEKIAIDFNSNDFDFVSFAMMQNKIEGQLMFDSKCSASLSLMICDIQGRKIYDKKINIELGQQFVNVDFEGPLSGVYFLQVTDGKKVWTKKLVV